MSDTDDEDTSPVNGKLFIVDLTMSKVIRLLILTICAIV